MWAAQPASIFCVRCFAGARREFALPDIAGEATDGKRAVTSSVFLIYAGVPSNCICPFAQATLSARIRSCQAAIGAATSRRARGQRRKTNHTRSWEYVPSTDGIIWPEYPPRLGRRSIKWRTRPYRIEERPVTLLHLEALWKRWPDFHVERAHDAIIAIVALENDPGERHQFFFCGHLKTDKHGPTVSRVAVGKGAARERIQFLHQMPHTIGIAPDTPQNVGEYQVVACTWNAIFMTGGNQHCGETS